MIDINCKCGHKIEEGKYPSKTKGILFPEANEEHFMDNCEMELESYISAIRNKTEDDWINNRKGNKYSPDFSKDVAVIDILNSLQSKFSRPVFECTHCGRVYIENKENTKEFQCYEPSSSKYNGALHE